MNNTFSCACPVKPASKKEKNQYPLPEFHMEQLIAHIDSLVKIAPDGIVLLVIDLFCGAGGLTEGFLKATYKGEKCAAIIAGINHDIKAIYSQAVNHPFAYYTDEDIRLANLEPIKKIVDTLRERFPQCPVIVFGGVECTNHSNAKGGQSRDNDSRTLAFDLNRYVSYLQPDGLWIENVKEFRLWGPLVEKEVWKNKKGKPAKRSYAPGLPHSAAERLYYQKKIDSGEIGVCPLEYKYSGKGKKRSLVSWGPVWVTDWRFAGTFYKAWLKDISSLGFEYKETVLNAADYGVPQNRKRLFVLFMKKGYPIAWPEPTHSEKEEAVLFRKKPYVPIRTCIDFSVEGKNIFEPGHVRSDETWKRLLKGLISHIANGKQAHILKQKQRLARILPDELLTAINTPADNTGEPVSVKLTASEFMDVIYGNGYASSVDNPSPTLRTNDCLSPVTVKSAQFILNYQGQSHSNTIETVANTLQTKEKLFPVTLKYFIYNSYTSGGFHNSVDKPSDTILSNPKNRLVTVDLLEQLMPQETGFIYNPSWLGHSSSLENPSVTLIASQHKSPLYYTTVKRNNQPSLLIPVFHGDSPALIAVKEFMALYNIYEIRKRGLLIKEMLKIQSFREDYFLAGTHTNQTKFIGNAVPPQLACSICEAMAAVLIPFISLTRLQKSAA